MPTIAFATGFEHQDDAVAGGLPSATEALWQAVGGTHSIQGTTTRSGSYALQLGPASGGNYVSVQLGSGQTICVGSFYYKWGSASYGEQVLAFSFYEGSGGVIIGQNSSGNWFCNSSYGVASDTTGSACTTNWTRIDFRVDLSGSTWTIDWQIDGVAQTQHSYAAGSAGSMDHWRLGDLLGPTGSWTGYVDDAVLSYTSGDYPLGEYKVLGYAESGDGTHSNEGNFVDEGSNAISGANTAVSSLDYTQSSTWVAQTGNGTGDYLELAMADSSEGTDPDAVMWYYRLGGAGNPVNNAQLRIRESSSETTLFSGDSSHTGTDNTFWACTTAKPSTGAWTESAFNSTVYRWGYSSDANPDPILYGVFAELVYPVSAGPGGGTHPGWFQSKGGWW